jgi:hypothetical protein
MNDAMRERGMLAFPAALTLSMMLALILHRLFRLLPRSPLLLSKVVPEWFLGPSGGLLPERFRRARAPLDATRMRRCLLWLGYVGKVTLAFIVFGCV